MTVNEPAVAALIVIGVGTLLGVLGLWAYMARHSERVERIDRRVSVLEERVTAVPAVRAQLDALTSAVASIDERSKAQTHALHSINEHLRTHR